MYTVETDPAHVAPTTSYRERVKVLYILGWGRSGSTVIDAALGSVRGFCSAGELHSIFDSGFRRGIPCGCGAPVAECPVWGPVLEEAVGSPAHRTDRVVRLLQLQRSHLRERRAPLLLSRLLQGRQPPAVETYVDVFGSIYSALGRVTSSRVIVDSSKVSTYASLLPWTPGVEPYFVHLLRDPRATAYSWARHRTQPGLHGAVPMTRMSPIRSTLRWDARNMLSEVLCRKSGVPSLRLHYEAFAADTKAALERIIELVGEDEEPTFVDGNTVVLPSNHSIGGNPVRFAAGQLPIRPDQRWMRHQSGFERVLSTATALPLLRRYGYPLRA
jgi:hypothetical protein